VYRDQLAPQRARLSNQLALQAKLEARVRARFSKVVELNDALRASGFGAIALRRPSSLATRAPETLDVNALDREALAEQTGITRDAVKQARAEARQLGRLVRALRRRLQGEVGIAPLGAPPRQVPVTYLLAEWSSLPTAFLYSIAAVYAAIPASSFSTHRMALAALLGAVLVLVVARHLYGPRGRAALFPLLAPVAGAALVSVVLEWTFGSTAITAIVLGAALANGFHVLRLRRFLARCRVADVLRQDGAVLYDPAHPSRMLHAERLLSRPRPDSAGYWSGSLPGRGWVRALLVPLLFALALWALFQA
jgi:hypothetical protein